MSNGGMKVPKGIDALAGAVPEEIPDHLFTEDESITSAKKQAPPSVRKMPAAKPPLPPSARKIAVAPPVVERAPAPTPEPAPIPSSFPSVGKQLVVEIAPRPAPTSLDALVTAVAPEPTEGAIVAPRESDSPVVDDAPVPAGMPAPLLSRARFVALSSLVAAGIVAIGGSVLWSARTGIKTAASNGAARTAVVVTPPVTGTPPPPAVVEPPAPAPPEPKAAAPAVAPEPPPAANVPAAMGRVKTEGATPGRRIFVDQRTVGQTPEAVVVKCGVHRIRIGSAGKTTTVEVPCGGEVEVRDR